MLKLTALRDFTNLIRIEHKENRIIVEKLALILENLFSTKWKSNELIRIYTNNIVAQLLT